MSAHINRREFVVASSLAALAPLRSVRALASAAPAAPSDRILVSIFLAGGNDGINTVVPWRDDEYARHRKVLRLGKDDVIELDDETGLHGSLRWLGKRLQSKRGVALRGVGYPRPDRSHFASTDIWFAGRRDDEARDGTGWLGRALDSKTDRAAALHVGEGVPPVALRGTRTAPLSMASLEDLALHEHAPRWTPRADVTPKTLEGFAQARFAEAFGFARRLEELRRRTGRAKAYTRSAIGQRLQTIAAMLELGCPHWVFSTQQEGYDTHSEQGPKHAALLRSLDASLEAFFEDVGALGLSEKVLVLVFSEFGRTLAENASGGTDHGTAGPVFLIGPKTKGPLFGEPPSLSELVDGEPQATLDYRRVYATLLARWLAIDPAPVIGPGFEPIGCLA